MDAPSLQLQGKLDASIQETWQLQNPILTHLTADNSWVLSLPCPKNQKLPQGRSRFNILIDPWLKGPEINYFSWFNTLWHTTEPAVQGTTELNALLKRQEESHVAKDSEPSLPASEPPPSCNNTTSNPYIDLVVICHEFPDHCHRETLVDLDPATPILATTKALSHIKSWKHFSSVHEIPHYAAKNPDWRTVSTGPIPNWLGIGRIVWDNEFLRFHSGIAIFFPPSATTAPGTDALDAAEAIIYTPHGIHAHNPNLTCLATAEPPVNVLALLHGLHHVTLAGVTNNLGAPNGLESRRVCKAKYWISTHDEVHRGKGIVSKFLRRRVWTVDDAVKKVAEDSGGDKPDGVGGKADGDEVCIELRSGESIVLR